MADRKFDRIVSVGMFEHVGMANYPNFFSKMAGPAGAERRDAAAHHRPGGKALGDQPLDREIHFSRRLHAGTLRSGSGHRESGLMIRDIEILPMHYAHTLRAWRERFTAPQGGEAVQLYDERCLRMWESSIWPRRETAFLYDKLSIFQIQLSHQLEAVPYTRNYIGEREERLRVFEKTRPPLELVEF